MNNNDSIVQEESYMRLAGQLDRLPHALLLHGPPGIGKLELAEHFAKLLLCEARGSALLPCGRCDGCRWFASGSHPDLRIVEPEAIARKSAGEEDDEGGKSGKGKRKPSIEIRIEQIRALDDFVHVGSHRAKRRVAIIHPAEDMNAATSNALLKNLEEPPADANFLLVAHRPARLLPTIRSRCVQVAVPLPDAAAAAKWLETRGVQDAAAWLAYAGGAPRRAMETASGEQGAKIRAWRQALAGASFDALEPGGEREDVELLVDFLQKHALDSALACVGLPGRYRVGGGERVGRAGLRQWLAYARALGRHRALSRHPLNPKLFATELMADFPGRKDI